MGGTYQDLRAWQEAVDLVTKIYRVTASFPREETYGLSAQMRRAAVSVPSSIAEGKGRASDKDLCRFLANARGSLAELETQLVIARELKFLERDDSAQLLVPIWGAY